MTVLWIAILERFNKATLNPQAMRMDLKNVLDIYKSSIDIVTELRTDEISEKFMNDTKEIIGVEDDEVGDQRRRSSSKRTLKLVKQEKMESFFMVHKN